MPLRTLSLAAATLAIAAGLLPAAASAAPARPGDTATVGLSAAGKRSLKTRGVTLAPVTAGKLRLAVRDVRIEGAAAAAFGRPTDVEAAALGRPTGLGAAAAAFAGGGRAVLALDGRIVFRARGRSLTATSLVLTLGGSAPGLTGVVGRTRVRLLAVATTPAPALNGSVAVSGARVALTRAAGARLKSALRLARAPSTAVLGTLAVKAAPAPTRLGSPAPAAAGVPAAAAPTPSPTPAPACPDFAATPAGSVDWFACDLPAAADLKSWTDYVQRPFPAVAGCASTPGSVTASGGATRIDPASAYDHRFPVAAAVHHPDGSWTVRLDGAIAYVMPAHGIDERIGDLRLELAADGLHGAIYADGQAKPRDTSGPACGTAAEPYAGEHVLDLDLTGISPITAADGSVRWIHVPADVAAGSEWIGGGAYPAGRPWGAFTIALPPEAAP
jgi:hypothetical protein